MQSMHTLSLCSKEMGMGKRWKKLFPKNELYHISVKAKIVFGAK